MTTNEELIAEASRLIADCMTYNFGTHNADKLAHEIAPKLVAALAALTAPPEGDARERLRKVVARGAFEDFADYPLDGENALVERVTDAFLAAFPVLSRTTSPDAATEAKNAWHLSSDVWQARALKAEAERDAALAAIERCRGVIASWKSVQASNREQFESGNPGMIVPIDCVGGLVAALDGAPEPEETEWVYRARNSMLNSGAHVSEEAARATLQLMIENHLFEVEPEPVFVERRPRFAWLPVEGEKP